LTPPDIHIDLLKLKHLLRIRISEGQRSVFDPIRRKWILLTSEEFVRQLLIQYLVREKGFPKSRISVEKEIQIAGVSRRYDLAFYGRTVHPLLLVECKSPSTPLDQHVFDQILHYNMEMNVRFLVVSNGTKNYCCSIDRDLRRLRFHDEIPGYRNLESG
jgi:hypothetical protein